MKRDPFNLELCRFLRVLMETHNLTAAANRLGFSKPAASRMLGNLREYFGDPLFIPCQQGMRPTPRMYEIGRVLGRLESSIETLYEGECFNPSESERVFIVATRGLLQIDLFTYLTRRFRTEAPKIRLVHQHRSDRSFEQLLEGKIDVIIAPDKFIPPECRHVPLCPLSLGVVARRGHPLFADHPAGKPIDTKSLKDYPRVMGQLTTEFADATFDALVQALPQRVTVQSNDPMSLLGILAETDHILISPLVGALSAAPYFNLEFRPLRPKKHGEGTGSIALIWSETHQNDKAHIWFRQVIKDWGVRMSAEIEANINID